jgi:ABC-type sulfate transport system permease component
VYTFAIVAGLFAGHGYWGVAQTCVSWLVGTSPYGIVLAKALAASPEMAVRLTALMGSVNEVASILGLYQVQMLRSIWDFITGNS